MGGEAESLVFKVIMERNLSKPGKGFVSRLLN